MSKNTPTPTPRKHLVESAAYWFDAARQAFNNHDTSDAMLGMENAYNHVENALAACQAELLSAKRERGEAREALSLRAIEICGTNAFIQEHREVVGERNHLRASLAQLQVELTKSKHNYEHDLTQLLEDKEKLGLEVAKLRDVLEKCIPYMSCNPDCGGTGIFRNCDCGQKEALTLAQAELDRTKP